MSEIGKPERETQRRAISLFRDELGYRFLGDWTDHDGNSNMEEKLLSDYLGDKGGYSKAQINAAIYKLTLEANNSNRGLYDNNHAVYNLFRYGVPVQVEVGKPTETVHLINWK